MPKKGKKQIHSSMIMLRVAEVELLLVTDDSRIVAPEKTSMC